MTTQKAMKNISCVPYLTLVLEHILQRGKSISKLDSLSEDHRTTEQSDGRILVEATVADTSQLRWWLLGFGSQVEVLEPISLREEPHCVTMHDARQKSMVKMRRASIW